MFLGLRTVNHPAPDLEAANPAGSVFGVIENPHFALPDAPPASVGPGR